MGNIEHGTCPNCNEWSIDEKGECTACGIFVNVATGEGAGK